MSVQLQEYLEHRRKRSVTTWAHQHQDAWDQARVAILEGEQRTLIFNWLIDYCEFPGSMTTFRRMADQWERDARAASAA